MSLRDLVNIAKTIKPEYQTTGPGEGKTLTTVKKLDRATNLSPEERRILSTELCKSPAQLSKEAIASDDPEQIQFLVENQLFDNMPDGNKDKHGSYKLRSLALAFEAKKYDAAFAILEYATRLNSSKKDQQQIRKVLLKSNHANEITGVIKKLFTKYPEFSKKVILARTEPADNARFIDELNDFLISGDKNLAANLSTEDMNDVLDTIFSSDLVSVNSPEAVNILAEFIRDAAYNEISKHLIDLTVPTDLECLISEIGAHDEVKKLAKELGATFDDDNADYSIQDSDFNATFTRLKARGRVVGDSDTSSVALIDARDFAEEKENTEIVEYIDS